MGGALFCNGLGHCLVLDWISVLSSLLMGGAWFCNGLGHCLVMGRLLLKHIQMMERCLSWVGCCLVVDWISAWKQIPKRWDTALQWVGALFVIGGALFCNGIYFLCSAVS